MDANAGEFQGKTLIISMPTSASNILVRKGNHHRLIRR